LSVAAVPLLALVTVPLVAAQLNALGALVELKGAGDPRGRLIVFGATIGRVVSVLVVCALCVAAYPGWIHPDPINPALARRVAWGVEPEPSLVNAAGQFHQWRKTGQLPDGARGLILNAELANYVAWFAPEEKVFINARYNHHRPELGRYVQARRGMGLLGSPEPEEARAALSAVGAEYIAIHHGGPSDFPLLRARVTEVTTALYRDWTRWSPWYVDGRTTVFGWHPPGAAAAPTFAALRVDPVALAFGPGVERLPDPVLKPPPPPLGWEEAFVRPAKPVPVGAAEAFGWVRYKEGVLHRERIRQGVAGPLLDRFPASTSFPWHALVVNVVNARAMPLPPLDPTETSDAAAIQAVPLLALRAARRAIAENPDHPDPYYVLFRVLQDPDVPLSEGERILGRIAALRQCLERMPRPEDYRRGRYSTSPTEVALQLAHLYVGDPIPLRDPTTGKQQIKWYSGVPIGVPPLNTLVGYSLVVEQKGSVPNLVRVHPSRVGELLASGKARLFSGNAPLFLALDVGHKTLGQALEYARVEFPSASDEDQNRLKAIEELRKNVETALILANDQYTPLKNQGAPLPILVDVAVHAGLAGEALALLTEKDSVLEKEYKEQLLRAAMLRVGLEVALGRVEDADENLRALNTPSVIETFEQRGFGMPFQALRYQKAVQTGEYKAAGELLEAMEGRAAGAELLTNIARYKVDSKLLFAEFGVMPPPVLGGVLPSVTAFEALLLHYQQTRHARDIIAGQMQQSAQFFLRRGVLSLLEGDIGAARERFVQTHRAPPAGWHLNAYQPRAAAVYLELIRRAHERAGP
jgi:hypothetical protein